jgi:hypothetical protein
LPVNETPPRQIKTVSRHLSTVDRYAGPSPIDTAEAWVDGIIAMVSKRIRFNLGQRLLRPVCYQDFPDALPPASLRRDAVELKPHRMDGVDDPLSF